MMNGVIADLIRNPLKLLEIADQARNDVFG
jgi:hypothetical protein